MLFFLIRNGKAKALVMEARLEAMPNKRDRDQMIYERNLIWISAKSDRDLSIRTTAIDGRTRVAL